MTHRTRTLISSSTFAFGIAALAACTALQQAVPPAPKTPAQTVFEVKAAFVTAEDAALAFAEQICPNPASCSDTRVTAVANGIVAADTAISAAEVTVTSANTSGTDAQTAVTAAQNALAAFQTILTQYGITTAKTQGST